MSHFHYDYRHAIALDVRLNYFLNCLSSSPLLLLSLPLLTEEATSLAVLNDNSAPPCSSNNSSDTDLLKVNVELLLLGDLVLDLLLLDPAPSFAP